MGQHPQYMGRLTFWRPNKRSKHSLYSPNGLVEQMIIGLFVTRGLGHFCLRICPLISLMITLFVNSFRWHYVIFFNVVSTPTLVDTNPRDPSQVRHMVGPVKLSLSQELFALIVTTFIIIYSVTMKNGFMVNGVNH